MDTLFTMRTRPDWYAIGVPERLRDRQGLFDTMGITSERVESEHSGTSFLLMSGQTRQMISLNMVNLFSKIDVGVWVSAQDAMQVFPGKARIVNAHLIEALSRAIDERILQIQLQADHPLDRDVDARRLVLEAMGGDKDRVNGVLETVFGRGLSYTVSGGDWRGVNYLDLVSNLRYNSVAIGMAILTDQEAYLLMIEDGVRLILAIYDQRRVVRSRSPRRHGSSRRRGLKRSRSASRN